jgi:phage terminase large subunit-like protein
VTPEAFDEGAMVRALVDKGGLHAFIREFWPLVDPHKFSDNWHIGAIAEHLEGLVLGQIKDLVINCPPGHSKSLNVGVFFPAWLWTLEPGAQLLYGSFDQSLLNNQSEKLIGLLQSPEFRAAYPYVELASDKPALREFKLKSKGFRFNTSPGGKGTGRHVDGLVVDDAMKPDEAVHDRQLALRKTVNWYDGTLASRVRKWRLVIAQRLHEDDLPGQCIKRGYVTLILPARQVRRSMWARDPRKEVGELLWPEVFPEERVRKLEIDLDRAGGQASAQLQQDPTPPTGGFIEEVHTRLEWVEPPKRGVWVQSWDFSTKGQEISHSKVSGQLWCKTKELEWVREYVSPLADRLAKIKGSEKDAVLRRVQLGEEFFCLIDWVGGHWGYSQSKSQFVMAQDRPLWKNARIKLIELKANGPAIINELGSQFVGIKGIEPEGTKEERLHVHTEKWEAGQIIYPPGGPWTDRETGERWLVRADLVREEHVKFPRFTWDDHIDTATQALDRLCNAQTAYRENLRTIAARARGV